MIVTRTPAMRPRCFRMVKASSSAWVGCSLIPSPALMTCAVGISRASTCGAPDSALRTTTMSGAIEASVRAVSRKVSPLVSEEDLGTKERGSAERRLAASWNDAWVRVEGSMKRWVTVRPTSTGTRGTG